MRTKVNKEGLDFSSGVQAVTIAGGGGGESVAPPTKERNEESVDGKEGEVSGG